MKINYKEKIIISERIRDIKYLEKNNIFLLSLETSGSLGILKVLINKILINKNSNFALVGHGYHLFYFFKKIKKVLNKNPIILTHKKNIIV